MVDKPRDNQTVGNNISCVSLEIQVERTIIALDQAGGTYNERRKMQCFRMGAGVMNNAMQILNLPDSLLNSRVEFILYGRAALLPGFEIL